MLRNILSLSFLLTSALGLWAQEAKKEAPKTGFEKWDKEIAAIEKRQTAKSNPKGGIVFAGSSSIRLWKLEDAFPEWQTVNSGFGGSIIRDSTHFANRIIIPYQPKAIVFYAGDNDISSGRKPEQARDDFAEFVKTIRKDLPKTPIYYIPIKPSVARWKQFETQSKANGYIKEMTEKDPSLIYIDIVKPMLGEDGQPIPDLFVKDGLHMSPKGYAIWNELVKKAFK
jgi:lysophospholipase L1-like esterase